MARGKRQEPLPTMYVLQKRKERNPGPSEQNRAWGQKKQKPKSESFWTKIKKTRKNGHDHKKDQNAPRKGKNGMSLKNTRGTKDLEHLPGQGKGAKTERDVEGFWWAVRRGNTKMHDPL